MNKWRKSSKRSLPRVLLLPALCCLLIVGILDGEGSQQVLPDRSSYIYVGGTGPLNYSTIQEGIDNSLPGGTIFVHNGTYTENIVVNAAVTLLGEEASMTSINGDGTGNILTVTTSHCTIQNFTLQSRGMQYAGVVLNASNITVTGCIITECLFGGYSEQTRYNVFRDCVFISNVNGVWFDESANNTLEECTFQDNEKGFVLDTESNHNHITGCLFQGNTIGMFLWELSNFNVISQCRFFENTIGIRLWDAKKNNFFLNEFTENRNHTESIISDNLWYSLEPLNYTFQGVNRWGYVGNYWDDYEGKDVNGDGIGDIIYEVDPDDDDNYPLFKEKEANGIPGFGFMGLLMAGMILIVVAKGMKKQSL